MDMISTSALEIFISVSQSIFDMEVFWRNTGNPKKVEIHVGNSGKCKNLQIPPGALDGKERGAGGEDLVQAAVGFQICPLPPLYRHQHCQCYRHYHCWHLWHLASKFYAKKG